MAEGRYCSCGTRLARDNRGKLCAACRKVVSGRVVQRPLVPTSFWKAPELREALDDWHIGRAIRVYRLHEFHPEPIAQATVANWFGITQAQLSRIENGPPVTDLAKLIPWALILGIPDDLLWFKLSKDRPGTPAGATADAGAGATSPRVSAGNDREERDMRRRALLHSILAGTGAVFSTVALSNLAQVEQVRRELDKILDGSELGDPTIKRWETLPDEYAHRNQVVASGQLLHEIAGDFVELQGILDTSMSIKHRTALTRVAGQLALTAGWFMLDLGELRNAQSWFHTAGLAAGQTHDGQLTGSALVWSAVASLYGGVPEKALDKLKKARAVLGQHATPWRTRALLAQARALAELGRGQEAQRCLAEAETAFVSMPDSALADPGSGCPERLFLFNLGNAYTRLGMVKEADPVQRRALGMYRPMEHLDPALIRLDQARCMARQGDPASGCEYALRMITVIPAAHQGLVMHYGRGFLAELPPASRNLTAVRELHELLTTN